MQNTRAAMLALLVSGCTSTTSSVVATGDFGPETLGLINSYRSSHGLPPLSPNGRCGPWPSSTVASSRRGTIWGMTGFA